MFGSGVVRCCCFLLLLCVLLSLVFLFVFVFVFALVARGLLFCLRVLVPVSGWLSGGCCCVLVRRVFFGAVVWLGSLLCLSGVFAWLALFIFMN